ncbi:MAG TPA: cyanophycin synthetase [Clostridiaceae bacterium]|nr:cyanophycin synthetase [Clostridiaceae bacterium]
MKIYSIQTFSGRNIFSHKPVIKMVIDIGDLHDKPTNQLEGFNEKLLKYFPGLKEHYCSLGHAGGFVERLYEGTYLGHVIEHLALEMQNILGYSVNYGKTRIISEPSLYYIIFQYFNEKSAVECGKAAVKIVSELASGNEPDVEKILNNLKQIAAQTDMGPSTKSIYDEAVKRGIPVIRYANDTILQLGYGKYLKMVEASLTDTPSCVSVDMASNKTLTKELLSWHDIPVPHGDVAYMEEAAVEAAKEIGFPVVVKPCDGNQGKGVSLNIQNEEQVRTAFREAIKFSQAVIVEKFVEGNDYRVLVVGGKVSAVAERKAPSVIGDGVHTIKELVEIENTNELRGDGHEKVLTKIKLDEIAKCVLAKKGLDENYIPAANELVFLRENGNLSTGGTARECTSEIHPYNCFLAVKAAKIMGLDIAGIDITAKDISKPIDGENGAIIEVNAAPGLRMHLCPTEGRPINVASDILDMMFPEGSPSRIPIVSITGTNGKTTTTRLVKHVLSLDGKMVGMTSTSGIYIGNECILKGDNTGPTSAKIVLSNRNIDAAVLETARGGIVRKGLGYDLADVGVIVNISEDHLGLDSLNSIQDLAFVKSLVVEAVKPDGYAVLNADDEMTEYVRQRVKCKVILFSKERNNPLILGQLKLNEKAVYIKDDTIYVYDGVKTFPLIKLKDIPITMGGKAECNIENSLAAISALFALSVPFNIIKKGLKTFMPDVKSNPGRFNIFDMGEFKVMLDYGHNPAGYRAVIKFIQKINAKRLVGVIGMPGDRLQSSIEEVGRMCSKVFSKIYIKEDNDLRNRAAGEVADILYNSIVSTGFEKENIEVIYSELEALKKALVTAKPGDLIVVFYEEFEPALELIEKFRDELSKNSQQISSQIEETAG